jgi:hypothetical protein
LDVADDGHRFVSLLNTPCLSYGVGYRLDSIKTVTCMFKLSTTYTDGTSLFRFDRGGAGGEEEECLACEIQKDTPVLILKTQEGSYTVRAKDMLGAVNEWIHITIIVAPNAKDTRIYLDGRNITGPITMNRPVGQPGKVEFTRFKIGNANMSMNLAWFHIYSDRLTNDEIQRDMHFDSSD